MDQVPSDQVDGWFCPESSDVPEVILVGAGQVGVNSGWAQYSSFNSDHLGLCFS